MNKEQFFENIKSYKFLANKSLGQNFLIDFYTSSDIVDTLNIDKDDKVLEIGAGLGSLSFFLAQKEGDVTLIDVDENMVNSLKDNFKNVVILRQNILKYDVSSFNKIIGNLPYYITSGIIEHLLLNAKSASIITLMVQKEVYLKLTNKKEVSPLSLLLNYVSSISKGTLVNRNAFSPVPHVDSMYFSLFPNNNIKNEDNKELYSLICRLFLLRRKTILNNLTNITKDKNLSQEILDECLIKTNLRPEELTIDDYKKILKSLNYHNISIKY